MRHRMVLMVSYRIWETRKIAILISGRIRYQSVIRRVLGGVPGICSKVTSIHFTPYR